jgi:hypothetical protein
MVLNLLLLQDPDSQVSPLANNVCAMCLRLHDTTELLKRRQNHA